MGRNLDHVRLAILWRCYAPVCGVRGRATHHATHAEEQVCARTCRPVLTAGSGSAQAPSLALWSTPERDGARYARRAESSGGQGRALAKGRCPRWRASKLRLRGAIGSRQVTRSTTTRRGYAILGPNHPRGADTRRLVRLRTNRRRRRIAGAKGACSQGVRGLRGAALRVVSYGSPGLRVLLDADRRTPATSTRPRRRRTRGTPDSGCSRSLRRGVGSRPRGRRWALENAGHLGLVHPRSSGLCKANTRRRLGFSPSRTAQAVDTESLGSLRSGWDDPVGVQSSDQADRLREICQDATQPVTSSRPEWVDGPIGGQCDGTR